MATIPASYSVLRFHALPGQIADTSLYNVDGACAANGVINVGQFVFAKAADNQGAAVNPEGQYKIVSGESTAAIDKLVGVAVVSQALANTWSYEDGQALNVLTHGRVYVEVPASTTVAQVAFDAPVIVKADGSVSVVAAVAGDFVTGHKFTGELYAHKLDATKKLAKIQLIQSAPVTVQA